MNIESAGQPRLEVGSGLYVLRLPEGATEPDVVAVDSVDEWSAEREGANHALVAESGVGVGVTFVLTTFLGLDLRIFRVHDRAAPPEPQLFETRVCGGRLDGATRYSGTWAGALAQHRQMTRAARLEVPIVGGLLRLLARLRPGRRS